MIAQNVVFTSDNSGHNYYVPVEHLEHWANWCDLDEDNPESWDAPAYAVGVEGAMYVVDIVKII